MCTLGKAGLVALRQPRSAQRGSESGTFECREAQLHLTPTPLKRGGQAQRACHHLGRPVFPPCTPSDNLAELALVRTLTLPKSTCITGMIRRAGVMLMAGLWLAMVAFSTSAHLHQSVCEHAQQSSHECALVSFAKHQPWIPLEIATVLPPTAAGFFLDSPFCLSLRGIDDVRLEPGRAPPLLLLAS